MSLVVASSLIVPLQAEFFALEGLSQLMKTIERVKEKLNPKLQIRGVLLTMFDRRNKLSMQVDNEARDFFKEKVYKTCRLLEQELEKPVEFKTAKEIIKDGKET